MKRRKKRPVTLIEIMIVILLIGLIGSALAFNMRGSMDKGRAFQTEQNASRVYDILMMKYAEGDQSLNEVANGWAEIVKKSPLVTEKVLVDGWKRTLIVRVEDDDLRVTSEAWEKYKAKHE